MAWLKRCPTTVYQICFESFIYNWGGLWCILIKLIDILSHSHLMIKAIFGSIHVRHQTLQEMELELAAACSVVTVIDQIIEPSFNNNTYVCALAVSKMFKASNDVDVFLKLVLRLLRLMYPLPAQVQVL